MTNVPEMVNLGHGWDFFLCCVIMDFSCQSKKLLSGAEFFSPNFPGGRYWVFGLCPDPQNNIHLHFHQDTHTHEMAVKLKLSNSSPICVDYACLGEFPNQSSARFGVPTGLWFLSDLRQNSCQVVGERYWSKLGTNVSGYLQDTFSGIGCKQKCTWLCKFTFYGKAHTPESQLK